MAFAPAGECSPGSIPRGAGLLPAKFSSEKTRWGNAGLCRYGQAPASVAHPAGAGALLLLPFCPVPFLWPQILRVLGRDPLRQLTFALRVLGFGGEVRVFERVGGV